MKARCPSCNAELEGPDLQRVARLAAGHCKAKRASPGKPVLAKTPERPNQPPAAAQWRFDRDVLSQNGTAYAHWTVYAKDKKSWGAHLTPALASMGGRYWTSQWRLTRYYSGRHREMDFANLVGGFKPLPDILQANQVIWEDNPRHFKCEYAPQVRGDETYCLLELLHFTFKPT